MMYTRDQVRSATLAFFKNDALATDVFVDKYALRDQNENFYELTPIDSFERLAKEFARIESKYPNPLSVEQIYQYLAKVDETQLPTDRKQTLEDLKRATIDYGEIVPQGSPQAGIGNPYQLQSLSNCFVIESPQDSYGGILYTDQQQTQIMKRRGGVGFDISTIRPKGMPTTNAAKTTDGIGVFMERFSNSCREVAQGGRRGALLTSISCIHPEVETFINIKRDKLKVTGANVSVRVTDEFMNAVENDLPFTLQWPVDVPLSEAKITKVVRARDIWEQFVDAAWYSAEPGILFWDKVIRSTPSDCYAKKGYRSISCNPCLTGDTLIAVADERHYVSIKQLADEGKDLFVYAHDHNTNKLTIKKMRNPRVTGYNQPIYKVTLEGGHSFKATANHKMIMIDGDSRRVDELKSGDQLWTAYKTQAKFDEVLLGVHGTKSQNYFLIKENDCGIDEELINLDSSVARTIIDAKSQGYDYRVNNGVEVKKICEQCGNEFWTHFKSREHSFCSSSCSQLYSNSKVENRKKRFEQNNRTHSQRAATTRKRILDAFTQLQFELKRIPLQTELIEFCKKDNIPYRLGTKYGFKSYEDVKENAKLHNHRVVSVEFIGNEDVYNGTVDDVHTLCIALGEEKINVNNNEKNVMVLLASEQCGEITLSANDACRLEVLDLRSFVKDPWAKTSSFDYKRFDNSVQVAQRLLDDLVDLEIEIIDKIIDKINADPENAEVKQVELSLWKKIREAGAGARRTGLGVTGLADALAMLGLKYGSQESINVVEQIYQALALGSYRSSVKMAEERGPFPVYEYDLEKDHLFLNQIFDLDQDLKARWQKFGRRNIANTTTAPVGSLSTILRCSSGIEPVFLLSYDRRRKINASDVTAKVDFVDDLGDRWQQYTIYHHGVKQWMDATGASVIKESPYFGATSSDVDWNMGIKLQAAAQKWVCHAISKCLTRDVLITTDKGLLYFDEIHQLDNVKVDEFEKLSNETKLLNRFGEFEVAEECYNNGIKNISEVVCSNGLHLKCTPNERVIVLDDETGVENWKEINDLNVGDRVKIGHVI